MTAKQIILLIIAIVVLGWLITVAAQQFTTAGEEAEGATDREHLTDVGRVTGLNECGNTPHAHAYEIRANFRCGKARELARAYWAKAVRKSKIDIWVRGFRCEYRSNTFRVTCRTERRSANWTLNLRPPVAGPVTGWRGLRNPSPSCYSGATTTTRQTSPN